MENSEALLSFVEKYRLVDFTQAFLILVVGFFLAKAVSNFVSRLPLGGMTAHGRTILRRVVFYIMIFIMLLSALRELGFDLSVLLGAAGILSVAIGFASQTSASNLISGLFLMIERPFSIGDVITADGTTGEVISIDLLSVKIRTFDNLFVRIPNESMIKQQVTTLTKFPIRRFDMKVGIAYKEDIERVRKIMMEVADLEPMCLTEPAPLFIVTGFGSSSVDLQFSVWAQKESFLALRNTMYEKTKKAFDEQGIEIPFPHLSLYAGSDSSAIKVEQIASDSK